MYTSMGELYGDFQCVENYSHNIEWSEQYFAGTTKEPGGMPIRPGLSRGAVCLLKCNSPPTHERPVY